MSAREDARIDWENGMKYKEIAEKYAVNLSTVKSWAARYWKKDRVAVAKKKVATKEKGRNQSQPASQVIYEALSDTAEQNDELTEKQKDFCVFYMQSKNATRAYMRAYECDYASAAVSAHHLLKKPKIIEELKVLREVKKTAISCLFEEDIVDLHMRIAFADITDYVDFKSKVKPVLNKSGGFVYATNPKTEEKVLLTYTDNEVTVKDSTEVDGLIINEISQGRNGLKIKLADRMKSLEFLERYFELNPQDKHKIAYDNAKLEIEREKLSLVKDKDNVEIEDTDETDDMIYGEDLS